ncbi:MAG: hypothetical protein JSV86_16925 [Gemmatimonadota bacterium]|nr:MAG: hypothetical protein JSV86_16925 [Gemmatimonadota bacterium]
MRSHDYDCPGCGICDGELTRCCDTGTCAECVCGECGNPPGDEPGCCDCFDLVESDYAARMHERRSMGFDF